MSDARSSLGRVFISHSSVDKPWVRRLDRRLRNDGYLTWLDEKDMYVGDALSAEISQSLKEAKVILVIISSASVASKWLKYELDIATERLVTEDCLVIPVLKDDVEVPPQLAGRLWADMRPRARGGYQRIARALDRAVVASTASTGSEQPVSSRRRIDPSVSMIGVLALGIVAFTVVVTRSGGGPDLSTLVPSRAAPPLIKFRDAKKTAGPCKYAESPGTLTMGNLFDVGLPPDPNPTPTTPRMAVFTTNQGTITVLLLAEDAPCNVQSIVYLISKKFYDNTPCPRLVNSGIFVLQCGDPTGTTAAGPSYSTKDENLAQVSYTAGTLAMANKGPNTNGSQFFFITKDSNGALRKDYTVIGHVTAGLNILQKVVAGGDDDSNPVGGGKPKIPLYFKTVRITD